MPLDHEMDEDSEVQNDSVTNKIFSAKGLFIIAVFVFIFIFNGRLGKVNFDAAFFYGSCVLLLLVIYTSSLGYYKNKTPKIIWDGGHGTTLGKYHNVGNFLGIFINECKFAGMDMPSADGVIFIPRGLETKNGRSWSTKCIGKPLPFERLDRNMQSFIRQYRIKPPYIVALASEEQYRYELDVVKSDGTADKKKLGVLAHAWEEQNETISILQDNAGMRFGTLEKTAGTIRRMGEKFTKKKNPLMRDRSEEDKDEE